MSYGHAVTLTTPRCACGGVAVAKDDETGALLCGPHANPTPGTVLVRNPPASPHPYGYRCLTCGTVGVTRDHEPNGEFCRDLVVERRMKNLDGWAE